MLEPGVPEPEPESEYLRRVQWGWCVCGQLKRILHAIGVGVEG